jgi:hypothetical protein
VLLFATAGQRNLRGIGRLIGMVAVWVTAPLLFGQTEPNAPAAASQPDASLRRFEFGGQAVDIRLGSCVGSGIACPTPQFGLGAGAALNLGPRLAVDTAVNVLPRFDRLHYDSGVPEGGHATEFLLGPRAQVRARQYGFFVAAKPGLLTWSQVLTGFTYTPISGSPAKYDVTDDYGRRAYFATELSGGVEYSPAGRVRLRVEMGDLLVHYSGALRYTFPGGTSLDCSPCAGWTSNLQTVAGVYFDVGKPIDWNPPRMDAAPGHNFFDRTNIALMGASLLGQMSDAITTQRFLAHGDRELDPLAAPFVKYGWSGQIGLGVLVNGAEILSMYGLHRMHQPRIERILPLGIAAASGAMAYRNLQLSYRTK